MTIEVSGNVPGFASETGGHRIQRIPPTEKRGRVHTSTVTVSVLSGERRSGPWDRRAENDFAYRWYSGSGAGGQHRNKHQNCLEITHLPTGVTASAQGRSREANLRDAMAALRGRLDAMRDGEGHEATNALRAAQIGCGMRGDKRRTYRFQDDTVTDHVTGKRAAARRFMRGDIEVMW